MVQFSHQLRVVDVPLFIGFYIHPTGDHRRISETINCRISQWIGHTVDGFSESPRPTTLDVYIKTLVKKGIVKTTFPSTGELIPDFWLPSTV